jgi:hypothetical protein
MKKTAATSLMAFLGIPLLGAVTWYCVSFLPHLGELRAIEIQGGAAVSSAPLSLYRIALAAESKASIRTYAITQAYWHLGCKEKPKKMLSWHLNGALWLVSGYLHFSEQQVFSLWVYYAPYKGGRGLANASLYYFNKPLSELNEEGFAALVAAAESPPRYVPGTKASWRRIREIIEKTKLARRINGSLPLTVDRINLPT